MTVLTDLTAHAGPTTTPAAAGAPTPKAAPAPAPASSIHPMVDRSRLAGTDAQSSAAHRVYEHLVALWAPGVIEAAQDLGAFAALTSGPATAAELARTLDTDPRATRVLLDGLHAYDIVERAMTEDGEIRYTLPVELHDVFSPGGLYSLAGKINYDRSLAWNAWRDLAHNVRTGARDAEGGHQLNQISEEEYTSLVRGINFWAPPIVSALADALREQGWSTGDGAKVLDVGCGTGIYSQLLLREFPLLTARGLDVARITPIAIRQAKELGVADRFEPTVVDFFHDSWGGGDLALFVNIFHLQTAESARELMLKAAKEINEDGVIAIADHIVVEDTHGAPGASDGADAAGTGSVQNRFFRLFAASMLATGGGDAYTVEEYDGWLADAGLRRIALIDTPMHRLLLAKRA